MTKHEALERVLAAYKSGIIAPYRDKWDDELGDIRDAVETALATPARNCEVFRSEEEAKSAFLAYYNEAYGLKGTKDEVDYCDLKHNVDGILHDYIKWLFAPAKGGRPC